MLVSVPPEVGMKSSRVMSETNKRLIKSLGMIPAVGATLAFALAVFALLVKVIVPDTSAVPAGIPVMMPLTAIGLSLSAIGLFNTETPVSETNGAWWKQIGAACAGIVLAISVFTLAEFAFAWRASLAGGGELGVDYQELTGRMAPNSALALLLISTSILLRDLETVRNRRPADYLALGAFMISVVAILTRLYSTSAFYGLRHPGMTLTTAIGLCSLSVGVICLRPRIGLTRIITSETTAGFLSRRLVPAALVTPALLGWIVLNGERAGHYDSAFAISLLVATNVLVFIVVIIRISESLYAADIDRNRAEEMLRAAHRDLEKRVIERTSQIETANRELLSQIEERKRAQNEAAEILVREQASRAQAEEAAELVRRLQVIIDISLMRSSLDQFLVDILHRIRDFMTADAVAILLMNEDKENLSVCAVVGLSDDDSKGLSTPMSSLPGEIASTKAPLMVADLDMLGESLPGGRMHSLMGAPLIVEGDVIGVLEVLTEDPRTFTDNDLRLLQLVADRVALSMEHARLYEGEMTARFQAETANRMKDEFLATVSHELRSPLNAILGWVRLLREGSLDKEASQRALETIERSARTQNRIVSDLLDVSRIITGKLRLSIRPLEPSRIVESAVEAVRLAAEAKSIDLNLSLDRSVGPISGDPDRVQQIVWNLLSNAIKFTPHGGRVDVVLARVGSNAEITVRDTGPGISPDLLPYVFDRFRQGDASSTRRQGGLGLGLAIVRHLTELHGGTVTVQSEGRGAAFTVSLPVVSAVMRPSGPLNRREASGNGGSGAPLDGLKVLVVDDDPDSLELVRTVLSHNSAEVKVASSSRDALKILQDWIPDLLISDIEMPEMDGYGLILKMRTLEQQQGRRRLPAIALTAYGRMEDRMRALASGFQLHLSKPIDPLDLLTAVNSVVTVSQVNQSQLRQAAVRDGGTK